MACSPSTGYRPHVGDSTDQPEHRVGVLRAVRVTEASDVIGSPGTCRPSRDEEQISAQKRRVDALVISAQDLVEAVLTRLRFEGIVTQECEELLAFGQQGLVEAAQRYDPERGPFRRFAYYRVRGAMIDGLRKMGPWSRRGYERVRMLRAMEAASESLRAPSTEPGTPDEAADRLRQHLAGIVTAMTLGVFAEQAHEGEAWVARDDSRTAEELLSEHQLRHMVREALKDLPQPDQAVMCRHYLDGERLDRIASDLGFSKSWASRIHARALKKVGARLRAHCR